MLKLLIKSVFEIFVFILVVFGLLVLTAQCDRKEYPPRQTPTEVVEQEDEGVDMLEQGKRHAEFWGMMIPAF